MLHLLTNILNERRGNRSMSYSRIPMALGGTALGLAGSGILPQEQTSAGVAGLTVATVIHSLGIRRPSIIPIVACGAALMLAAGLPGRGDGYARCEGEGVRKNKM